VKALQFFTLFGTVRPMMYHHILKLFKVDIIISAFYRTDLGWSHQGGWGKCSVQGEKRNVCCTSAGCVRKWSLRTQMQMWG
jgi:hypothetical protein